MEPMVAQFGTACPLMRSKNDYVLLVMKNVLWHGKHEDDGKNKDTVVVKTQKIGDLRRSSAADP